MRLRRNQVMPAPPGIPTGAQQARRRYCLNAKLLDCRKYRSGSLNHLRGNSAENARLSQSANPFCSITLACTGIW